MQKQLTFDDPETSYNNRWVIKGKTFGECRSFILLPEREAGSFATDFSSIHDRQPDMFLHST